MAKVTIIPSTKANSFSNVEFQLIVMSNLHLLRHNAITMKTTLIQNQTGS